jgi:hypothetical protein
MHFFLNSVSGTRLLPRELLNIFPRPPYRLQEPLKNFSKGDYCPHYTRQNREKPFLIFNLFNFFAFLNENFCQVEW